MRMLREDEDTRMADCRIRVRAIESEIARMKKEEKKEKKD